MVGLSILSGSHAELIPAVLAELRDAGADVPVVVGGIIPKADEEALLAAGVARVYTPKDFEVSRIMGDIVELVAEHHGVAVGRLTPSGRQPRAARAARGDRSAAPGGAEPDRGPLARGREADRGAAGRGLPRRARRRGARAPRGGDRAARRGQVDAAVGAGAPSGAADGRTVAVLAVDPSSKRSGGSLLGDRARIDHDPERRRHPDPLHRRRRAARRPGRAHARGGRRRWPPAFDVVVVETVGVGQSETDVEEVCDTVAVVVQPGSGDTLQFLKAGIMEVPDVLVVTKADLGDVADAGPARPGAGAARARARARCRWWPCRRCRRRRGSTSWSRRSTRTAQSLDLPAARLRAPAHGRARRAGGRGRRGRRCARSAGGARRSGSWRARTRRLRRGRARARR